MSKQDPKPGDGKRAFSELVDSKVKRKIKAQQHVTRTVWSGLGMMGLIG